MALSPSFRQALELYKFERKYGTLRSNRHRLLDLLENAMLRNCRQAFPGLAWHTLWQLADGSLAFVTLEGEKRLVVTGARLDAPFVAEYYSLSVLKAASGGKVHMAPVSTRLVTESDPALVARFHKPGPIPPRILRELLQIYRIHFHSKILYGYLREEREVAVNELQTCLGRPVVDLWGCRPRRTRPRRHFIWLS